MNGLKTLYARFSDLQAGDTLEDGVKLGDVTSQLQKIGVQVLNGDGKMRGVGDIMEDLMGVWQSIDQTQKAAVAQTLAGKYQLSRFEALMNSPDMYNQYKDASTKESQSDSTYGTMDVMNEKYLDSMQGRLNKIQATVEGIIMDITNSDGLYPWLDAAQGLLDTLQSVGKSLGGMQNIILFIVNTILKITRTNMANALTPQLMQIASGVSNAVGKVRNAPENIRESISNFRNRKSGTEGSDRYSVGADVRRLLADRDIKVDESNTDLIDSAKYLNTNQKDMTSQQRDYANKMLDAFSETGGDYAKAKEEYKKAYDALQNSIQKVDEATEKDAAAQEELAQARTKSAEAAQKQAEAENASAEAQENYRSVKQNAQQTIKEAKQNYNDVASQVRGRKVERQNNENAANQEVVSAMQAVAEARNERIQAAQKASQEVADANVKYKDALNNLTQVTETETQRVNELSEQMKAKSIENVQSSGEKATNRLDYVEKALSTAVKKNGRSIEPGSNQANALSIGSISSDIEELKNAGNVSEDAIQDVQDKYNELREDFKKGIDASNIDDIIKKIESLKDAINGIIDATKEAQDKIAQATSDANENIQSATDAVEKANAAVDKATKNSKGGNKKSDDEKAADQLLANAKSNRDIVHQQNAIDNSNDAQLLASEKEKRDSIIQTANAMVEEEKASTADAEATAKKAAEDTRAAEAAEKRAAKTAEATQADLERARANQQSSGMDLTEADSKVGALTQKMQALRSSWTEFTKTVDLQKAVKSFMELGNAAGDYYISIQQLSNIGSIWNQNDITEGEKLNQTFQNLIFSVPQLASGLLGLSGALKGVGEAFGIASLAGGGLPLVISAIATALSVFIAAAQGAEQASQQIQQNNQNAIDSAQKSADSINSQISSWQQLYDEYKKTGKVSDEFKSSSDELAKSLGNGAAEAQAASGNYDALAKSIQSAQDAANQKIIDEVNNDIGENGENAKSRKGSLLGIKNGSAEKDLSKGQTDAAYSLVNGGVYGQDFSGLQVQNFENDAQRIGAVKDEIAALQQKLDSYGDSAKAVNMTEADWNQQTGAVRQAINQLNSALQTNDIKNYANDLEKAATASANMSDVQNTIQSAGADFQKIQDAFTGNSNISTYFESLGSSVSGQLEKVQFMIDHVSDDAQKQALAAQQAILQLQQNAQGHGLSDNDVNNIGDQLRNSGMDNEQIITFVGSLDKDATFADFQDKLSKIMEVLNNSNLSKEDSIKLMTSFDPDQIVQNANEIIAGLNNGDSIDNIIAKIKVDDSELKSGYQDSYDSDSILKNLGVDQDEVDSYIEILSKSNDAVKESIDTYNQQSSAISDNISKLQDQNRQLSSQREGLDSSSTEYRKLTSQIEDNEKAVDNANTALDSNQKELADFKTRAIAAQKAVDSLADNWEDWTSALLNTDGTASLDDQKEAIEGITSAVQGLTGIDMSGWTEAMKSDFVTNNLNDIKAAAEGDIDALNRLREAAATQILIQAGLDDTPLFNGLSYINNYIANYDGKIVAGAYLNDDDFENTLTNMINNTIAAGGKIEDITRSLASMGIDVEVEMVPVTTRLANYEMVTTDTGGTTGQRTTGGLDAGGGVGATAYWRRTNYTTKTDMVPKYHYKFNGNALGSGSGSNYTPPAYSPRFIGNTGGGGGSGSKGGGGGSGKSPKKSGGGGGSGKSPKSDSGSGSGSTYEPKSKDYEEDEVDRYERVNTLLDSAESTLDNIKKDQDRVTGKQLLENMEKQIPILNKQIDLENQKLDIQKQEAQELANQLGSQYGIQFDSEGFISNYQDVHDQLLNNVNSLINQYNATGSESGQEALEDQIDAAKKKLDSFNDAYKRYDELWGKDINDTIGKIKDLQDAIEDLQIDAFNKSAEAVDNIKDINKTLDELNHNMHRGLNGDDPFDKVADDFSKANEFFDSDKAKQYYDTITAGLRKARDAATTDEGRQFFDTQLSGLQQGYNTSGGQGYLDMALKTAKSLNDEINKYESTGRSDIFGENGKELYDAAKTSLDQLGGLISDYWDTIDDIHEDIKDMIDDVADRMDRRKQSLTDVGDELEHIYNVSEALYGEKAYDNMNAILDRQNLNNEAQIDMLQHQIEVWQNLQKSMDKESDEFKDLDDKIRDATKDINDLIEDSLDKLRSKYENTVDKIVDKWANDPFGGYTDSLDWANTEWEAINDNADYYLDDMNRAYQIDKLRSKYLDLLDGSNDLANQRRITDQMNQQLGYLRDKTNLSQYDVQYAQAQLDILQKQIALEDARNNKNQMKLRRDSQGNYRYVYTANEENTRSAQQDLADSTMDAYNLSKDQNVDTQKNILDTLSTYADRVKEIMKDTEDDSEERARRIAETQEWLNERLGDLGEQLTTSQKNLVDDVIKACDSMVEDNGTDLDEIYNQLINGNDEALGQIDRRLSDSIVAGMGNMDDFKANTQEMVDDLIDSDAKWQDDVDDLSKNVGQDFKDITKAIGDTDKAMKSLKDTNDTFYASLQDKAGVIQNYEGQMQSLAAAATDADNKFRAANATMQDLGRQLKQKEMENANLSAQVQDYQSRLNGGSGSGSGGGAGGAGGGTEGDAFGIAQNIWTYGSWANDPVRRQRIISRYGADTASRAQQIVNEYVRSGRANQLINRDSRKYGYDTGGYTGDWSDNTGQYKNGKFALLHQKEIVLNKTDTSNILDAVNIVRGMVNALKTGLIQQTVNDTANAVSNVTNVDNGSTITQDVHITAEFPNANNADEIESALLSLNDRSLQYSFKNFGTN